MKPYKCIINVIMMHYQLLCEVLPAFLLIVIHFLQSIIFENVALINTTCRCHHRHHLSKQLYNVWPIFWPIDLKLCLRHFAFFWVNICDIKRSMRERRHINTGPNSKIHSRSIRESVVLKYSVGSFKTL